MRNSKQVLQSLIKEVGIKLNGEGECDIVVNDDRFYNRVLSQGSMGLGESYMDGWWDVKKLDEFFYKILRSELDKKIRSWKMLPLFLKAFFMNVGRKSQAFNIGEKHYDIGNDLYEKMLDKNMVYTCGYWKEATDLDSAQIAKLDMVCRKIGLEKGMKVLDIGCGWGSFAAFAASEYGAKVVGVTVSKEQMELGKKKCNGLAVELLLQDYRDTEGKFDRIVSLGMFEHVGHRNYRTYMQKCHDLLTNEGLFLLHTIGRNTTGITTDPWIDKYIFPNSLLPSIKQIAISIENLFVMEDWHNFSADYDTTLMHWFKNFENSWDEIKTKYNERFYRMWKYYLLACAGTFRSRKNQLWQIVLSKNGVLGGYNSIR